MPSAGLGIEEGGRGEGEGQDEFSFARLKAGCC